MKKIPLIITWAIAMAIVSLLFTSCTKEALNSESFPEVESMQEAESLAYRGKNKVDICHRKGNGSYHIINVNQNAVAAHLAHGDILLEDADGDGVVVASPCTPNGDCDDNDPNNYPGNTEVCGDGQDNNCDGVADEGCVDFCRSARILVGFDLGLFAFNNENTAEVCYIENFSGKFALRVTDKLLGGETPLQKFFTFEPSESIALGGPYTTFGNWDELVALGLVHPYNFEIAGDIIPPYLEVSYPSGCLESLKAELRALYSSECGSGPGPIVPGGGPGGPPGGF